ncbi:HEAT repeat domain-containing protein [Roseofilum sp. BLCC_M154]|uniref:HEAT repeat domain-containing protein n=1 Tax=Roseofilum acuticapitatum BLCC-M154 TaxID=3022444 RepID=A0ABT7AW30_9CYAN|nr:HEAT repeat domain-containing protein [Roseofilum acuticapitatum]MDJ1170614.1 HEAT repeat domain-containing protein [Roseofilum acuticapitatum BLCC-M154]
MKRLKTAIASQNDHDGEQEDRLYLEFQHEVEVWQEGVGDDRRLELLDLGLRVLRSGDFQMRWDVAKLLPKLGSQAIAPLLQLLADEEEDEELRWFAGSILEKFNQPVVIAGLLEVLRTTESEELRALGADILSSFGDSALAVLQELLENPMTRELAVGALIRIRHPEVISALLKVVPDENPQVYTLALEGLSYFQDPRVVPALMMGLEHLMARVRSAAVVGLGLRCDRSSLSLVSREQVVGKLRDRLWDFDLQVCKQAAIALGRLATLEGAIALSAILRSHCTPKPLQQSTIQGLGLMLDSDSEVAHFALETLLERFLSGRYSETITLEIVKGVAQVQPQEQRERVTSALIEGLNLEFSPRVKGEIALSLGYLKCDRALVSLIELLAEAEIMLRLHAIAALKPFGDLAHKQLQHLSEQANIPSELRDGLAIALQEW